MIFAILQVALVIVNFSFVFAYEYVWCLFPAGLSTGFAIWLLTDVLRRDRV